MPPAHPAPGAGPASPSALRVPPWYKDPGTLVIYCGRTPKRNRLHALRERGDCKMPGCRREVVLVAVLFEGSLGALAAGSGWLLDCPPWQAIRWNIQDALLGVAATLPLVLVFLAC